MNDGLLVVTGAVPGAWLRFRVANHLKPVVPQQHWGTIAVNLIACFVLGLLLSLQSRCAEAPSRTLLLLGTGFLGSFSTFSTLMAELLATLQKGRWREAILLVGISLLGGLGAITAGQLIGAEP